MTLETAVSLLQATGIENPRFEAQLLFAHALGISRVSVLAQTYTPPSPEALTTFATLIEARAKRVPLAYLRGTQEFYGREFRVSPATLIPRPETELLIDFARERLQSTREPRFADVGTGSGCIIVSLLATIPQAQGTAFDISAEALEIAQENAKRHSVLERATFVQSDLLENAQGTFDLILSNPPYIPTAEIDTLQPEISVHEPRLALDGGEDGLQLITRLIAQAKQVLKPAGWLAMEVALGQAPRVLALLHCAGYKETSTQRDLAGIERVVFGRNP